MYRSRARQGSARPRVVGLAVSLLVLLATMIVPTAALATVPDTPPLVSPADGAPQMLVRIDGLQVANISVRHTSWEPYVIPISMGAGSHTVEIGFQNDFGDYSISPPEDRNLFVDDAIFSSGDVVQAESMAGFTPSADATANGGMAGVMWGNVIATTTVTLGASSTVTVRARGHQAGAVSHSTTPTLVATFTDPDVGNTGTLEFQYCTDTRCTSVLQSGSSPSGIAIGSTGSWTTTTPLARGAEYYWRARAVDSTGAASSWSETRSIYVVNTAPPVPAQVSPQDGAPQMRVRIDGVEVGTPFVRHTTWEPFTIATTISAGSHTIEVDFLNDWGFAPEDRNLFVDSVSFSAGENIEAESMTISGNSNFGADATASGGQAANLYSSGSMVATTVTLAASSSLTVRARGDQAGAMLTTDMPTLTGTYVDSDASDPGRLEFEICSDTRCTSVLQSGSSPGGLASGSNGSWTATSALGRGAEYYWRVRSLDAASWASPWSETRSFWIDRPPDIPDLVLPTASSATLDTTPALTAVFRAPEWLQSGLLRFQVCSTSDCSGVVASGSASGLVYSTRGSWTVPAPLALGQYYWRAQAEDQLGQTSAWSATRALRVGSMPGGPSLQHTHDTNASAGLVNPAIVAGTAVIQASPHVSWRNGAGLSVERQRVQVLSTPLTDVVGLWHFDGSTMDSSGAGHPAELGAGSQAPAYVSAQSAFGRALEFSGVSGDDIASVPTHADFQQPNLTIEAWIKPNTLPGNMVAAKGYANWRLFVTNGGVVEFDAVSDTHDVQSSVPVVAGEWSHVAATYDAPSQVMRLYVNGILRGSKAVVASIGASAATPMTIGSQEGIWQFDGSIDEVRYSTVARTPEEIAGYYNTRAPHYRAVWDSDTSGVSGLWHLDGNGSDASGHDNAAVLGAAPATPTYATAQPGFDSALNLDGIDDYARVPSSSALNPAGAMSMEAWIYKTETATDHRTILEYNDGTSIGAHMETIGTGTTIHVNFGGREIYSPSGVLAVNTWHHVAVTYDGINEIRLYVDGSQVAADLAAGAFIPATRDGLDLYIGRRPSAPNPNSFAGMIDEPRISSVARSAAEIAATYAARMPHADDPGTLLPTCTNATRCADIVYGSSGTAAPLRRNARYYARSKLRTTDGLWSSWSSLDWFERRSLPGPSAQHTHDTNAQAGDVRPTSIASSAPKLSWENHTGSDGTRHRTQVVTTSLDDVMGLWHLDGSVADSSGAGHPVVLGSGSQAPAYGSSQADFGQALEFSGVSGDDLASVPTHADFQQPSFTVEAWVKPGTTTTGIIATKGWTSSWRLFTWNGVVEFDALADTHNVQSSVQIGMGAWSHVAATYDAPSQVMRLYVNGVLRGSLSGVADVGAGDPSTMDLGHQGGNTQFGGSIDEVRYSSVARSAGEIAGYYRARAPHFHTLWDSDASDVGTAITTCADGDRCADIAYGGTPLDYGGARYHVRSKLWQGSAWSDWSNYDWFETRSVIDITAGATSDLGVVLPGADATGSSTIQVQTNSASGYTLLAAASDDSFPLTGAGGRQMPRWSGTPASPTSWPAGTSGGFGLGVLSATGGKDVARWGPGATSSDFANLKYAGPMLTTPTVLHSRSAYSASPDSIVTTWRANPHATQAAGSYAGTITYTANANP